LLRQNFWLQPAAHAHHHHHYFNLCRRRTSRVPAKAKAADVTKNSFVVPNFVAVKKTIVFRAAKRVTICIGTLIYV